MGLSKKRKQQISFAIARSLESRKHRKVDEENRRKKEIWRKQREGEDYWDEYEDYSLESSSDESECDEPSLDLPSSEEEEEEGERIKDKRKEEGTREGLGDDEGGVPLENKKRIFELVWKSEAGGYLRGVRGCCSHATKEQEIKRKKELEKSASHTQWIVEMFSAQQNKEQLSSKPSSSPDLSQNASFKVVKRVKTRVELQKKALHDLEELLRLKRQQIDKYRYELSPQSNYYHCHQMIRSFLWMQLNKEKDNLHLTRRDLAQIVAQSFNKKRYTGKKIVQWERSWVKLRVIPDIKAGNREGDLSWMEDEDLVFSIKKWAKKEGESKLF